MRSILRSLAFNTIIVATYFRRGFTAVARPDPPAFFKLVRRVLAVEPTDKLSRNKS